MMKLYCYLLFSLECQSPKTFVKNVNNIRFLWMLENLIMLDKHNNNNDKFFSFQFFPVDVPNMFESTLSHLLVGASYQV